MTFEELGLSEKLLKAIEEVGYSEPTPIQAQAIPIVLMARDVVGVAQTGTGKTASFTLPMIEILYGGRAKARMPRRSRKTLRLTVSITSSIWRCWLVACPWTSK
jgi:superfamily II DNA/RNA helicase